MVNMTYVISLIKILIDRADLYRKKIKTYMLCLSIRDTEMTQVV